MAAPSLDPDAATVRLTIDLGALARNWRLLTDLAANARCGAAVKADGYGLGAAPVATRLFREGCRDFFVADANEGAALRETLPEARIFVLNGAFGGAMSSLLHHDLIPVINAPEQAALWKTAGQNRPFALHVDTGMNRLGFRPEEIAGASFDTGFSPSLVMSHFACADDPAHPLNARQIAAFADVRSRFPGAEASLANSAGIFLGSETHHDLVRPGIALYGGQPVNGPDNPMHPVVTAESRILMIRDVPEGESISYGATARAEKSLRIAICGVGYADGFHRAGSGSGVPLRDSVSVGAQAAINGMRVPVIGRVTMDLIMLDVTDLPDGAARPGQWAEFFGHTIMLDDAARACGTIGYELLTGLSRRAVRTCKN